MEGVAGGRGGLRKADLLKYGALVVLVVQNSSLALTMRYSRARGGDMYLSSTAVVMSELVKLATALGLIAAEQGSLVALAKKLHQEMVVRWYDFAKLLVPAVLYTVQNNLAYVAVSNLDAATYQVLYQLKILTTAVFAVLLLRRRLDCGKWLALGLLVGGVSLVQLSNLSGASPSPTTRGNTMLGLACVLLACCSSGFAGIWFEKVLKGSECSVWVRNVELALIGGIAGLVGVYGTADATKVAANGFFQGYSRLVWSVILLQALGGIVVAVVVKYADNILKGFATSVSIVLSCLVSYAVFGEVELSGQFLLGTGLVILSTLMYSTGGSPTDLCGLSVKPATPNAATAAEGGSSLSSSSSAGASKTREGAAGGGGIFGAHGAGAVGGLLMKGANIPLTDPEEGRGLLMQEIELTESGADGGEGATPSPRPDATGHRRRALFG